MGHRYLAALAGVLALAAAVSAWRRRAQNATMGLAGAMLAIVFLAQVLAGAAMVWAGFATQLKAIHLSMATLVWIAMVLLATLIYSHDGSEIVPTHVGVNRTDAVIAHQEAASQRRIKAQHRPHTRGGEPG
jgi:heme A synthase